MRLSFRRRRRISVEVTWALDEEAESILILASRKVIARVPLDQAFVT